MTLSDTALLSMIVLVGIACQWSAWRLQLPAILFLLLAGILLGPVSGILAPDALFDDLLFPFVSLSIAVILFEGSMTLEFHQVRDVGKVVRRLVTLGALVTWALISLASYWLIDLPTDLAALFGALVVVTGPTVIVPMLRTLRATSRIANVLRWEGIIIDPIGALMAVLAYEWISSSQQGEPLLSTFLLFIGVVVAGTLLGALAALLLAAVLRRHWLPEYLQAFATLALVISVFTLSNELAHESGLLAVTVMGIWLANTRNLHVSEILSFKEHLSVLLISGLFIVLAARLDLNSLWNLGLPALALLAVIQFIVRPAAVALCTLGSDLNWRERTLIAWVGPRGIVAAAVSALFALRLEQNGYENAAILTALTFAIIIGTVVFQSATARPLANWLGVTEPEPRGLVIIGANRVARALAEVLHKQKVPVILIDASWENTREARMLGLETIHGNPLSSRVADKLELSGYGQILAATPQHQLNTLVNVYFRNDFGSQRIFAIRTESNAVMTPREQASDEHQGTAIGEQDFSFKKLASLISQGAEFKATRLTADYTLENWRQDQPQRALIAAISPQGRLRFFSRQHTPQVTEGWVIISIRNNRPDKPPTDQ